MSGYSTFQFYFKAHCHFWMGKSNSYFCFALLMLCPHVPLVDSRYLGVFPINRFDSFPSMNRLAFLYLVVLFSSRL